jgi:hypothetical protein
VAMVDLVVAAVAAGQVVVVRDDTVTQNAEC